MCSSSPIFYEGTKGWKLSNEGVGYQFGKDVTAKFKRDNKLSLIIHSHNLVSDIFRHSLGYNLNYDLFVGYGWL